MLSQPVVGLFQTVQTDGDGTQSSGHQFSMTGLIVEHPVGDDAPAEAVLSQSATAVGQVCTQQWFSTSDSDYDGVAGKALFQRIDGA